MNLKIIWLASVCMCAELSESELENIRDKVKAIRNKVKDTDYLINNLQLQVKGIVVGEPSTEGFKCYSITNNIKEVLEQYPFKTDERKLIAIAPGDFKYIGNQILTNHIFYNLIRNSLRAIQDSGKGSITARFKLRTHCGFFLSYFLFFSIKTISYHLLPKIIDIYSFFVFPEFFCEKMQRKYYSDSVFLDFGFEQIILCDAEVP